MMILAFVLLLQDDYRNCSTCRTALAKAMAHLKTNYAKERLHAGLLPRIFGGLAFMMHGECAPELAECVKYARQQLEEGPPAGLGNWAIALSLYFLAEYSHRFGRDAQIDAAIDKGLKRAESVQEKNGGWCHELGFAARTGYVKKNGATELSMLTAIFYTALLELKALGKDPGPMLDRARRYLDSLFDGRGFVYGSDNRHPDKANSRASFVLLALPSTDAWHSKIAAGVGERYRFIEQAHACAPLHYFAVGAAMHRLGPDTYRKCSAEWLHKLAASQEADGSVHMYGDLHSEADRVKAKGDVPSTAVFACLILMQRDGAFRLNSKRR